MKMHVTLEQSSPMDEDRNLGCDRSAAKPCRELALVDGGLHDGASLARNLSALRPGLEVRILQGGLAGMAEPLERRGFDAVHLLAHGAPGEIRLDADVLDRDALRTPAGEAVLAQLRGALAPGAGLLLYGCETAAGERGRAFVQGLANAIGAPVAAATQRVGSADLGGGWALDFTTGPIQAVALIEPAYRGVLSGPTLTGSFNVAPAGGAFTLTPTQGFSHLLIQQAVGLSNDNIGIAVDDASYAFRIYSPTGSLIRSVDPLSFATSPGGHSYNFTALSSGDVLMTYVSGTSGNTSAYFAVFNQNGQQVIGQTLIGASAGYSSNASPVAATELSNGALAFAWVEASQANVDTRVFTAAGAVTSAALQVATGSSFHVSLTSNAGGTYTLATQSGNNAAAYAVLNGDGTVHSAQASLGGMVYNLDDTKVITLSNGLDLALVSSNTAGPAYSSVGYLINPASGAITGSFNLPALYAYDEAFGTFKTSGSEGFFLATHDQAASNFAEYLNYYSNSGVLISSTQVDNAHDNYFYTLGSGYSHGIVGADTDSLGSSQTTFTVTAKTYDVPAPANVAPVLGGGGNTVGFTERGSAVVVNAALTASDSDTANLAGATITLSANAQSGDTLNFTNQNGIVGSYSSTTHALTLSGSATVAQYQAALESVTFSNGANHDPTAGGSATTRTVTFQVNDGQSANNLSNAATTTINVTAVNEAPALANGGNSVGFTERGPAVTVNSGLTVSDADSANLTGATVAISAGAQTGDTLSVTVQGGITGLYDASAHVLTLSGAGTLAQYQSVLDSVTFGDSTNHDPTAGGAANTRTIDFRVNDGQGADNLSNIATTTVNVAAVNEAPTLGGAGGATAASEQVAVAVAPSLTVGDVDSATLSSATVSITTNFAGGGEDVLGFSAQNGVSGSYDPAAGVLTLTGGATVAQYQAALRTVTYIDTVDAPSTAPRTISFSVSDGSLSSTSVTQQVSVAAVNDPPTVTAGQAFSAPENQTAVGTVAGSDPDANDTRAYALAGAGPDNALFDISASGVLTFKQAPDFEGAHGAAYTVTVQATDAGGLQSAPTAVTVNVSDVNEAPLLGGLQVAANSPVNGPLTLQPNLTVTDRDAGAFVSSAQVAITSGLALGDQLSVASQAGVAASYDAQTGVLTLTGAASDATYQAILRTATFVHDGVSGATSRTIGFTATDNVGAASAPASETVGLGGLTPPPPPLVGKLTPSQDAGFAVQIDNLLRVSPNDPAAFDPASPISAALQAEQVVAAKLDAGQVSAGDAQAALFHLVDGTVSVAEISYAFFAGKTPTAAGLNYLVHSPANANDLNDAYYLKFSTENRYINFASNLGRFGDATTSAFHAAYDNLSLRDAAARAYAAIFGTPAASEKLDAILNALVPDGLGGVETRAQYFAYYGTDGLNGIGTKSAMIGWLLADSVKEGFGTYQQADLHFLQDLAHGTAAFNVDLLATYGQPPALAGQPTPDTTLGG